MQTFSLQNEISWHSYRCHLLLHNDLTRNVILAFQHVLNCALPSPGPRVNSLARQSTRASNVSIAGPNSMISQPGWLAFFDLKLCSVRCGDEFGLEFNWNGALNPVLWFCGGWYAFTVFFSLRAGLTSESSVSLLRLLTRGNSKSDKSLKRLRIALKSKMTIEKPTRHWGQLFLLQNLPKFRLKCLLTFLTIQTLCNMTLPYAERRETSVTRNET